MRDNRSWVGHHDFANSGEIRREAEINQSIIEAKFQTELSHFRMSVKSKLIKHGALSDGVGVALFQQEVFEPDQPSSILQTMVCVMRTAEPGEAVDCKQSIRIITNELINTEENDKWLAIDFTADEVDDTQYFVGVFDLESPNYPEMEMIPGSEKMQQVADGKSPIPLVPLFNLKDDKITLSQNFQVFTPAVAIPVEGKNESVAPFGSYEFIEHKVQALDVGVELLGQIAELEPIYVGSGAD